MIEFVLSLADKVSGPASAASSQMAKVSAQAKGLQSSMSGLESQTTASASSGGGFASALESMVDPAALAAAAMAAATAIVAGLGAALYEGALKAIDASENLEKMTTTLGALGGVGAGSGKQILDSLDALSGTLPQTRDQLAKMAQPLLAMGMVGDKLTDSLKAQASAMALVGDGGGQAFDTLAKKIQTASETGQGLKIPLKGLGSLADMGLQVDDVAQKMGVSSKTLAAQLKAGTVNANKFGAALNSALIDKGAPALAQASNTMDALKGKFEQNITKLFEGVDVSGFMGAMKDMLSIFDQNTASGKALKVMVTAVFNKLFEVGTKYLPVVKKGLLELVVIGLKLYIQGKPLIKHLGQLEDKLGGAGTASGVLMWALQNIYQGFAGTITVIDWTVTQIGVLVDAWQGITKLFDSGKSLASNFIDGITQGLDFGKVIAAVKKGADAMVSGMKGALGIHSPSSVMRELGAHTAAGFAEGVGGGGIASSASTMAASATSGASGSSGGGGGGVTVMPGAIVISGVGTNGEALTLTENAIALIFERLNLEQGG